MISDSELRSLLASARTIVVVGLSTDPAKASARVASYLQAQGYRIIPVHPQADRLLVSRWFESGGSCQHRWTSGMYSVRRPKPRDGPGKR